MSNNKRIIIDTGGNECIIALECEIKGRKFAITTNRKIFEKVGDNNYIERNSEDEETKFLAKYIEPPKSLDIEK